MRATSESVPRLSIVNTMQATVPKAQSSNISSALTLRMIQLPRKRPTIKMTRASEMTFLAPMSVIHPAPVTKMTK